MPNFDQKIDGKTVGDAFDITRRTRGYPVGLIIADAYLTVMANGASDIETTYLFRKHITSTPSDTEGVIGDETTFTVTASGAQQAGATQLLVDALATTIDVGVVLQFSGGAWAVVTEKALQGATIIKVAEIDGPIADNETAQFKSCLLTFKIKTADSVLIVPNKLHPYDIQVTFDNSDPYTIEDGTINLRPQRTIGV